MLILKYRFTLMYTFGKIFSNSSEERKTKKNERERPLTRVYVAIVVCSETDGQKLAYQRTVTRKKEHNWEIW